MIGLIYNLLVMPFAENRPLTEEMLNEPIVVSSKLGEVTELATLKKVFCRDKMTSKATCPSFDVGIFKSIESQTNFQFCFKSGRPFNQILNADENIRLIKHNGSFLIMGETINAGYMGTKGIKAAAYIKPMDCKEK